MTVFGWDASNYDDPIRVRDGIDFYTHKAAEGHHNYYDPEYRKSLDGARALGIPILGAYFVNHPGSVNDQVDWFVQVLDQDTPWWREHPCFILQIDAEKFDYMDRAPNLAEIQGFGDRLVHVHGVDPRRVLAYAPQWLYHDSLAGLTYRLWASNYGANPVAHYRDCYPGDGNPKSWQAYSGQTPLILQYGSNTTIGDQTTFDANAYRGTLEELLAELGGGDDMADYGSLGLPTALPKENAEHPDINIADQWAALVAGKTAYGDPVNGWYVFQRIAELNAKLDQVLAALAGGVEVSAKVGLTDEAIKAVADATADEIAADPERDGADT